MDEASSSGHVGVGQKEWRQRFLEEVLKSEEEKSSHFNVLTQEKYLALMQQVEEAKIVEKKSPLQQRRLKRFDVIEIGGVKKLTARNEENTNNIKYYLTADELYDIIDAAHVAVGHGGRDRMLAETSKKFANVTKKMICLFLSMCVVCQQKKTKRKKGLVSKPILHSEMNSRCQVDLIDFQTQPDGKFKFILVYQDHLTKFVLLRPLESKRAEEVAYHLNDIFLTFGAPCILQSDNGREFVNRVILEVTSLWPELKIVHGKTRHSQSQGSVERANQDIENMLSAWMNDSQSTKWSEGLRYVQFMKNRAFHSGIKQSPYKAMFGAEPRVGLSTTSLPSELLKDIEDEEDLRKLFDEKNMDGHENEDREGYEDRDEHDDRNEASENILEARTKAAQSLEKQAKKMKATSDMSHPPAKVGDNIIIPTPDVDRAKGDLRNVIGIVLEASEDGFYKIGTKHGVLQKLYCRNEFDICAQKFLLEEEVDKNVKISLRTAAIKHSVGTGQGFFKCSCTKKCTSNRCLCKKNNVLCNSKCHNSLTCNNK